MYYANSKYKIKMELNEKLAFYMPYGIVGIYRLGDVVDNAPNPDEMRRKVICEKNVDFFLKYCKPILNPIEDAMTMKVHFGESEDYLHNKFFGFTNFKAYWREYEAYGISYWHNRGKK
jgi:hypothetical protein